MKCWPTLAESKPQHLSMRQAQAANISCMNTFFDVLEKSSERVDWTSKTQFLLIDSGIVMRPPSALLQHLQSCSASEGCTK